MPFKVDFMNNEAFEFKNKDLSTSEPYWCDEFSDDYNIHQTIRALHEMNHQKKKILDDDLNNNIKVLMEMNTLAQAILNGQHQETPDR